MNLDFVVVGMPKSGTSSFYSWLNSHPKIEGSNPKETFYFMDLKHPHAREDANYNLQGVDKYKNFFEKSNEKLFFEATTHYYYQNTALNYFAEIEPNPIIVFLLRKPSERIFSSFRFTRENLANIDKIITFDVYVDALINNDMKKLKSKFYSEKSYFVLKKQLELNKYVKWINEWDEKISSNNLYIIIFEEFIQCPKKHIKDFCDKLNIDNSFYEDFSFKAKNETKNIKYHTFHRFAHKINKIIPDTTLTDKMKSIYFSFQNKKQSKNYQKERKITESKEKLEDFFYTWNKKLEDKYNLNLNVWL